MGADISTETREGKEREHKVVEHKRRDAVIEKGDRCVYPSRIMRKALKKDGYDDLSKLLIETKSVIAGSYPLHALLSTEGSLDWRATDMDIWVSSKKNAGKLLAYFIARFGILPKQTSRGSFTFEYNRMRKYIDVIYTFPTYKTHVKPQIQIMQTSEDIPLMNVIKTFDISVCRCVYDGRNLFQFTSYPGQRDFCTKKIAYITPECVPDQTDITEWLRTLFRVNKYARRGFIFKKWGVFKTIPDKVFSHTMRSSILIMWNSEATYSKGVIPYINCMDGVIYIYHTGENINYPARILKSVPVYYKCENYMLAMKDMTEYLPPIPRELLFNKNIKQTLESHLKEPRLVDLIGDMTRYTTKYDDKKYPKHRYSKEIKIYNEKKIDGMKQDTLRSYYSAIFPGRTGYWSDNPDDNRDRMINDLNRERDLRKSRNELAREEQEEELKRSKPSESPSPDIVKGPGEYTDEQIDRIMMDIEKLGHSPEYFGLDQPTDEELRKAQEDLERLRKLRDDR